MNTFEDLNLDRHLFDAISRLGFTEPTKIQGESIPLILEGEDVIGESATGSGKTLAFGVGAVDVQPRGGIQSLILTPTRELAEQVKETIKTLTWKRKLNAVSIYGGVSYNPQIKNLERAEIVVATPGRLLDHIKQGTIDLRDVKMLVLDEADRMLDMGFIDDVEKIIKSCPTKRQTLFFSATMAPAIQKLARKHMNDPKIVQATKMVDPDKLEQIYFDVSRNRKMSLLINLLREEKGLALVFSNTRRNVDFVTKNLDANGIKALPIHGGMQQNKRMKTIKDFHEGRANVLVCTDVAARGIHIDSVSHVYNYDIPNDPKEYVHRIGRTARAGESGIVINMISEVDYNSFSPIFDKMKIDKADVPKLEKVKIVIEQRKNYGRNQGNQRGKPRRSHNNYRRRK